MTVEEEQAVAEKEAVEAEAAELASFESEMTSENFEDVEDGETPPADTEDETPPEETPDEDVVEEETVVEEKPEKKEPHAKSAKITEEQLAKILTYSNDIESIKTAMESRFGNAFGKLGSLAQTLKTMQDATGSGEPVTVSEDDLAELKADYPDLTPAIAKSLTRVMARVKGGVRVVSKDVDPELLNGLVDTRAQEVAKKIYDEAQIQDLTDDYPDWATTVGKDGSKTEFRQWLANEPAEFQVKVKNSKRAVVVARALDKFYDYKKQSTQPKPKKKTQAEVRREQLQDAVHERGQDSQHQAQSEEDAFNAHMAKARAS